MIFIYLITLLIMLKGIYSLPSLNPVISADFLARQNQDKHRTQEYGDLLVLRRGEQFHLSVNFKNDYQADRDKTRLMFCFRNCNSYENFNAQMTSVRGRQARFNVTIPPSAAVGKWNVRVEVTRDMAESNTQDSSIYHMPFTFYIIFNAWCPDDQVFMNDERQRHEYVMNQRGRIYQGTYLRPEARTWTYGQFDPYVLPTVIYLLDRTKLDATERADVVKVSRAVSAIVNSNDEGGIAVGQWDGKYTNGLSPWSWTGSATIFKSYVQSGYRPVRFAQCWVFGGLTTTVLRALGIPSRTITNFLSAHDTDGSLSVDKFYANNRDMTGVNGDTAWNFHVWSDAWMSRDDLPPGFGGWQAIDATPQETSEGIYQTGPASLRAVKQGKVRYAYDVRFVFSEVNAYVVHWQLDGRYRYGWRRTMIQRGNYGRKILTKRVGSDDTEDIIDQYKYPDDSPEANRAYLEAVRAEGLHPVLD